MVPSTPLNQVNPVLRATVYPQCRRVSHLAPRGALLVHLFPLTTHHHPKLLISQPRSVRPFPPPPVISAMSSPPLLRHPTSSHPITTACSRPPNRNRISHSPTKSDKNPSRLFPRLSPLLSRSPRRTSSVHSTPSCRASPRPPSRRHRRSNRVARGRRHHSRSRQLQPRPRRGSSRSPSGRKSAARRTRRTSSPSRRRESKGQRRFVESSAARVRNSGSRCPCSKGDSGSRSGISPGQPPREPRPVWPNDVWAARRPLRAIRAGPSGIRTGRTCPIRGLFWATSPQSTARNDSRRTVWTDPLSSSC
jgi:hypothetical protein